MKSQTEMHFMVQPLLFKQDAIIPAVTTVHKTFKK